MKYPFGNYFKHYGGVLIHKTLVFWYCFKFSMVLIWRGIVHDNSKFMPSESSGFLRVVHRLKKTTYGTPEYFDLLKEIKPNIDKHYKRNAHHPEHWPFGIRGMDLIDLVEMFCDWQAAIKKHKDGNIFKSIEHNAKRFDIPKELEEILFNSVPGQVFDK